MFCNPVQKWASLGALVLNLQQAKALAAWIPNYWQGATSSLTFYGSLIIVPYHSYNTPLKKTLKEGPPGQAAMLISDPIPHCERLLYALLWHPALWLISMNYILGTDLGWYHASYDLAFCYEDAAQQAELGKVAQPTSVTAMINGWAPWIHAPFSSASHLQKLKVGDNNEWTTRAIGKKHMLV